MKSFPMGISPCRGYPWGRPHEELGISPRRDYMWGRPHEEFTHGDIAIQNLPVGTSHEEFAGGDVQFDRKFVHSTEFFGRVDRKFRPPDRIFRPLDRKFGSPGSTYGDVPTKRLPMGTSP